MEDLFETMIQNTTSSARRRAKKKPSAEGSRLKILDLDTMDESSYFDLDHAIASRSTKGSLLDEMDWANGWSGEDEVASGGEEL
jgi:hypothetical protein